MCGGGGGGPGGDVSVSDAAGVVTGVGIPAGLTGGEVGQGTGLGHAGGTGGVGDLGAGGYGGGAVMGAPVVGPGSPAAQAQSQTTGKTVAKVIGGLIPPVGLVLGGLDALGAFDGIPGSLPSGDPTGPGGLGGPGGPHDSPGTPLIRSTGPPVAPVAPVAPRPQPIAPTAGFSTLDPITPGTVQVGSPFSVERGQTPAEIDAANRLRAERDRAYAQQRAAAEAEMLKTLGMRDVAYVGGPKSRLTAPPIASERALGIPPTLGQSRHRYG